MRKVIFSSLVLRTIAILSLLLLVSCGNQEPVEVTPVEEPELTITTEESTSTEEPPTEEPPYEARALPTPSPLPDEVLDKIFYADTRTWPYQPEYLSQMRRGKYYIPVQGENKIAVIDPDMPDYGLKFIETEFVQPHHPWIVPGMRYVYINFQSEGKGDHDAFAVLDSWNDEIIKYIHTGTNDPFHGAFSPTENIYVTGDLDFKAGRVHIFESEKHELLASIETTGIQSRDVLITHDGRYAFIGHQGYDPEKGITGAVDLLDIEKEEIIKSFGEGRCRAGRMSNNGELVFYSCDRTDEIMVINTETLKEVKRIKAPEGSGPFNLSFRPDDKYAYVGLKGAGELAVVDVEKLEIVKRLVSGTDTNSTFFHPYAPLAVVGNDGTDSHVSILDTEKNEIIDQIETRDKSTHNGQWFPDGRWFIITNRFGDSVTLLKYNDEAGKIEWVDDIVVGFGAAGVHWTPYFCGVQELTTENLQEATNAPAINGEGECGEF
jgi:DNA-binding beta-propeller fold protein YncE